MSNIFGSTGPGFSANQQANPFAASTGNQNLFSGSNTGLFASAGQKSNPFNLATLQQPQQQQQNQSGFTSSFRPGPGLNTNSMLPYLIGGQTQSSQALSQQQKGTSSLWSPAAGTNQPTKSIPEQIEQVYSKWDPARADTCVFQHYFYNYVGPERAPFYRPQQREDEKKWEEALSKKPDIGFVPALAIGFEELLKRIMTQMETLNAYNTRLHEINKCLEAMLQKHDLVISIRALDAKRRHTALSQRCLALATKVQVLRNRGYAMGGEEEDLKKKLLELEKGVFDPALGGRAEEIWARMVGIRERIRFLQGEMGRLGKKAVEVQLSEEVLKQAEKVLSDYAEQITHLKRELSKVELDLKAWEEANRPANSNDMTPGR